MLREPFPAAFHLEFFNSSSSPPPSIRVLPPIVCSRSSFAFVCAAARWKPFRGILRCLRSKLITQAAQQQVPGGEMRRAKREDIRIYAYTCFRLRLKSHDEKGKMHLFFRQIENVLLQTAVNGGSCIVHSWVDGGRKKRLKRMGHIKKNSSKTTTVLCVLLF